MCRVITDIGRVMALISAASLQMSAVLEEHA
jgi:hypothetical protein